ncbi:helix-turn-helix transcriptional regulator [Demequina aurantiaca]|uniref:helix-turn-helix transcriptional regulator n=1 Tax=Demequina aurantiaca TaxID=676200 RepID=UPI003D33F850
MRTVQPGRLSGPDAALYLGVATQTLANWRNLGRGPKYMRQGRLHARVYYKIADLDAWIDEDHEVLTP